jgi:ribosome-associated translation inhibitor RaiA
VEIIFHAHHAIISEHMRARATRALSKFATRVDRPVDAVVRFEGDGPTRRVEIVFHAARGRRLVAEGHGRYYGPALKEAVTRLLRQLPKKHTPRAKARVVARVRALAQA